MFRWLVVFVCLGGCTQGGISSADGGGNDASVDIEYLFPEPNDDLVVAIGTESSLDVATWNLENFPAQVMTPSLVADFIVSMDLDIVGVQEITDVEAFDELVERLRGFDGVLSSHRYGDGTFQKIGFIYKTSVVQVLESELLFERLGFDFPRPPLEVKTTVSQSDGTKRDVSVIVLHMKAGRAFEDQNRRLNAVVSLEQYVRARNEVGESVIMMGDFNDVVTTSSGREVFSPFIDDARYQFLTEPLGIDGEFSFLPSETLLDHLVLGAAMSMEVDASMVLIPDINESIDDYEFSVSDHRPVVARLPL